MKIVTAMIALLGHSLLLCWELGREKSAKGGAAPSLHVSMRAAMIGILVESRVPRHAHKSNAGVRTKISQSFREISCERTDPACYIPPEMRTASWQRSIPRSKSKSSTFQNCREATDICRFV